MRSAAVIALVACVAACDAETTSASNTPDASIDHDVAAPGLVHEEAGPPATAPDAGAPLSVLFIGNSLTYVNDLPLRVHELAPRVAVESEVAGAATFYSHWSGTNGNAKPAIAKGGHTHVVLQAQSYEPIGDPTSFMKYGTLLIEAVKAAGAKPVLYETFAYRDGNAEAMQDGLTAAYEKLGKDTSTRVAPVGEAWRLARKQHPEIKLHLDDGVHPAPPGTYLAACVMTMVLTGEPLALAARPPDVMPADAEVLRQIANVALGQ